MTHQETKKEPLKQMEAQDAQPKEQYNGTTLLVEAYAALWVLLMAWIFLLWKKQRTIGERLDDLERVIDEADAKQKKA